ncbi:MAG: PhoU domain-containing protein [Candidatus Woesearchaeota archaeon]
MDIRNVQKTGNMFYVYLPTNWCKQFNIKAASKVTTYQNNDGSLSISADIKEKELQKLDLKLSKENQNNINKLIVACYVNPLKSFTIHLEKELDISKLLLQKKLLSVELVEFDRKNISCESSFSVDNPLSLLRTMIRKIKNLIYIMSKNYNKELIERYEEEIDRSNMHINKSVISMITHNKPAKHKIIELHYMSNIARDLEKLVDHFKEIKPIEKRYISIIEKAIDELDKIFSGLDNRKNFKFDYNIALNFSNLALEVPYLEVKNKQSYHKVRVKSALESISEILMNWSITEEISRKNKN